MENIVDIFRSVIQGLGTTIPINGVTVVSAGVYSLAVNKTKWIRPVSQKSLATVVTINAVQYDVTAVVYNESITITTATDLEALFIAGTITELSVAAPVYINGTQLAVQAERKNKNSQVSCPFVWLVEPFIANENVDRMKIVGATPDITMLFLDNQNSNDWSTAQHYAYVIQPMDELVEAFKHKLLTTRATFQKVTNWRSIRHAKFGEQVKSGHMPAVINEKTSGVEVRFTVEILKNCECC